MPKYSDELINEVFSQNDIVDYVSQYVKLRKNGRDYTGLCPFHKEKSPSFHVNQEKQLFHCFGCGVGGNLVQFVMRAEGLDFVEALKLMADRAGIILPEDDSPIDSKLYQKKKRILDINKTAARFYYETLTKSEPGRAGLEYLKKRAIDAKTITKFGLGYAPDSFDALKKYMNKLGFSDSELLDSGLLVSRNGKAVDKFRRRVIFPIIDLRGNVIAFGGRIIDASEKDGYKPPKYLNSPDTPVFNKGKNLFSLNLAKKESQERCILCEGYMDVISVYKSGVTNITATLGTALTEEQAKLLMKYTDEILLCYDSDEAGQAATKRAIEIITSVGGKCRIMQLTGAKDPDEYINKNGAAKFREVMDKSIASTDYLINGIRKKYNLDTTDGKALFVEETSNLLAKIPNAIEADAYIKRISDETEISKDAIYSEIRKHKSADKISTGTKKIARVSVNSLKRKNSINEDAEKKLLSLVIESKASYNAIKDEFLPSDYSNDVLRRLSRIVYDCYERGEPIDSAVITAKFEGDEASYVSEIFCNLETYSDEKNTIAQLVNRIKIQNLDEKIEQAKKENDVMKLRELLDLRLKLGRE
ncbi:MAG TPA: DNA primase [Clostridiales bacterium]|nr:DNA primase [Clostridiales bacterium]